MSDAAAYPPEWESDVVLRDGGTVRLRPMRRDDGEHLLQLYSRLSDESLYLRFFSPVPAPTARDLELLTATDYDRRFAIVAELGEEVVAVARYIRLTRPSESAEIAFTVEDDQQGRGLGTVMLEHLAAIAREKGIRRFVASTMTHNTRMLGVFADAGFDVNRTVEGGVVEVSFDIEPTDASRQAQHHREQVSEARSVVRILAPTSVAVVGASRHAGTIGYGVLTNLLDGGFKGPVYPVNPNAASIADVPAFPTVDAVPGPVDLAVVCVPAPSVPAVVDDCVRKGVQGLVVISAGFAEVDAVHGHTERDLVERARRNGMRMIGPNCMGVVNTNPGSRDERHVRAVPPRRGTGRLRLAIRWPRHRSARALGRARPGHLHVRLAREQGRPEQQRPPPVLGGGSRDRRDPPVSRVVREPAQVRAARASSVAAQADHRRQERSEHGRRTRYLIAHGRSRRARCRS